MSRRGHMCGRWDLGLGVIPQLVTPDVKQVAASSTAVSGRAARSWLDPGKGRSAPP